MDSTTTTVPSGCKLNSWLFGYYLMADHALLKGKYEKKINYNHFFDIYNHYKAMNESEWTSLPELTNDNGSFCKDSCGSQLWSVATLLEAINTLKAFT